MPYRMKLRKVMDDKPYLEGVVKQDAVKDHKLEPGDEISYEIVSIDKKKEGDNNDNS